MLLYSYIVDILIIILIILFLLTIFHRYLGKSNLQIINSIIKKYLPVKVTNWFKRDKGIEYNDKIVLIMFIIYTILLFYLIILKIIIISSLYIDLDTYIRVHNFIHGKDQSIVLFMTTLYNNKIIQITDYKYLINNIVNNKYFQNKPFSKFNLSKILKLSNPLNKEELLSKYRIQNPDKMKDNKDLSFLVLLGFKNLKNNFNWKWLPGLLVLIFFVLILKYFNLDLLDIVFLTIKSPIFGKSLTVTFIIVNIIFILRYIFLILLIYLISKNKLTKSIYLPFFLIKSYDHLESLSKSPDLNFIIDLYYKHMVLYLLLFFISLGFYFMVYFI